MNNQLNRKKFILSSILAAVSAPGLLKALDIPQKSYQIAEQKNEGYPKICVFSKCLHWLNYADMAKLVAELGFDGVDLTVRPAGHVLPERVADDLPRAVRAIEEAGLKVYMITTNIKNATEKHTADILKAASSLGIKYYRTAWYDYDASVDVPGNIQIVKNQLYSLEKLNRQYNMQGTYQNHAGHYFGASVWDLWLALKDIDPQYISCQYDIRHATAAAPDNWNLGLNLMRDHIKTINIKDFAWGKINEKLEARSVPIGQGVVDFAGYLRSLKKYGINVPISMHYEYPLGGAEDGGNKLNMPVSDFKVALKSDLEKFKDLVKTNYL